MVCVLMKRRLGAAVVAALLLAASPAAAQDNSAAGRRVFVTNCAVCHTVVAGGHSAVGPNLFGVVGRRAGAAPGFVYSPAMRSSTLTWTPAQLDAFVQHPTQVVPGTRMPFAGLRDPQQSAALVAYLSTLRAPATQ